MTTIRLITKKTGVGLIKDVEIVNSIVSRIEGVNVEKLYLPAPSGGPTIVGSFQRYKRKLPNEFCWLLSRCELGLIPSSKSSFRTLNIFFQSIEPSLIKSADVNILIPNQEWVSDETYNFLPWIDLVICKTRYAENIFSRLVKEVSYTSFTSDDIKDKTVLPNYNSFFHLAGGSLQKGTVKLIDVWCNNTDWPTLNVIQNPKNQLNILNPNISYLAGYIDDEALRIIQNSHGCHLCLSEAEGFGHSIVEAMSSESVVMTTNGPPMNEIVKNNRGILVDYSHAKPQRLGENYMVDGEMLERKIEHLLGMSNVDKKRLGKNAREWYLENDLFFRTKFVDVIKQII